MKPAQMVNINSYDEINNDGIKIKNDDNNYLILIIIMITGIRSRQHDLNWLRGIL